MTGVIVDGASHSAPVVRGASCLCLGVAGIGIGIEADDAAMRFAVPASAVPFLRPMDEADLRIRAAWADTIRPARGARVFDAGATWRLARGRDGWVFEFLRPRPVPILARQLHVEAGFSRARLILRRRAYEGGGPINAFGYPLDELLLIHLLGAGRGVELHACGIVDEAGRGHLFVGQSGAGKTTMARQWLGEPGNTVLSDDRIVLRRDGAGIRMYGTPWHGDTCFAVPASAPLARLYFLEHGRRDVPPVLAPLRGARVAAGLLACAFVPFHDRRALDFSCEFLDAVAARVPAFALRYAPPCSIAQFICRGGGA